MTLKKILFSLVASCAVFVLLEIAALMVEKTITPVDMAFDDRPGWQAEFFRYRMDFHEADPRLLWRHRPNLDNPLIQTNSEGRLGGEIPRPKGDAEFRILLLGDSSPVGLGLMRRNEAFGEQLRLMLNEYFGGGRRTELINAAVSGYTSEQVRRLLEFEGMAYEPDLVLVHCGSNDGSISGQFTDRQLFENQAAAGLREFCSKLAIYRVLKSTLLRNNRKTPEDVQSLTVRVPPDQYYQNLRAIAEICRDNDCPVIFMKPPTARLWPAGLQFKIFRHISGKDGRPIFPEALAKILGREIKYCLKDDRLNFPGRGFDRYAQEVYRSAFGYDESDGGETERYRSALHGDPDDPIRLNNLGVSFWEDGQPDSADVYLHRARTVYMHNAGDTPCPAAIAAGAPFLFNLGVNYLSGNNRNMAEIMLDSALQADYFSLRIKKEYWEALDSLAGFDNVLIINLPDIFDRNGGDSLFVDHCHPTRQGHNLIAQTLFNAIRESFLMK